MPLFSLTSVQLLLAFSLAHMLKKTHALNLFYNLIGPSLNFYWSPSDEELQELSESGKKSKKKGHKSRPQNVKSSLLSKVSTLGPSATVFKIKTTELKKLKVKPEQVDPRILINIPKGNELCWVTDVALYATLAFTLTQALFYYSSDDLAYDLSSIWILLTMCLGFASLARVTFTYFTLDNSVGERSICIVSGCIFFLAALLVLLSNKSVFEFHLDDAFESVRLASAPTTADNITTDGRPQVNTVTKSNSYLLPKLFLATICSMIAVTFTFPGFRFGQLFEAAYSKPDASALNRLKLAFIYLSNLLVVCLWIKQLPRTFTIGQKQIALDEDEFETLKVSVVILVNLIKLSACKQFIQMFLESGGRAIELIRQRGTTTTNVEIKFAFFRIIRYVNVVAIQYVMPIILCLFSVLLTPMYAIFAVEQGAINSNISYRSQGLLSAFIGDENFLDRVQLIVNGFRTVFSDRFCHGVFGFATWWFHFSWFCTSTAGMIYHKYFSVR